MAALEPRPLLTAIRTVLPGAGAGAGYSAGMGGYSSNGMGGYASGRGDGYSGLGASRASSYASYGGRGGLGGSAETAGYGRTSAGIGGAGGLGSSSDDEHANALAAPTASLHKEVAGATKDVSGLETNIKNLREMLERRAHAIEPQVHAAVEGLADHARQVKERMRGLEQQAKSEHAQNGAYGAPGSQAIAAQSLGTSCARCGYSGSSGRY